MLALLDCVTAIVLYIITVRFDMVRVKRDGVPVARWAVGLQRAVRGELRVTERRIVDLQRTARVAHFKHDDGEPLELVDVALVHATPECWVLSGFERGYVGITLTDFSQTWVLTPCEGPEPQGSAGPPFPR